MRMSTKDEKRKQKYKERQEKEKDKQAIQEKINAVLEKQKPFDVRSLVESLETDPDLTQEKILPVIREMEQKKDLTLQEPIFEPMDPPKKLKDYFFAKNYFAYESWITIATIMLVLTLVLVDVRSGFFFYVRYIIVCFFMLVLSGWALTSAMFPELDDNLRFLERVATAIGLSIVVLVLDGLFLNYTFRFNPVSIALSLSIFILVCFIISIGLRIKLGRDGYIFKKKEDETIIVEVTEK